METRCGVEWRTQEFSQAAVAILRERYVVIDASGRPAETIDGVFWRVARAIAKADRVWGAERTTVDALARQFFTAMRDGVFLPNSPTLRNAGRVDGGQWAACFVLPVRDSLRDIFETQRDAALVHQSGGGTGFDFSKVRPAKAHVRMTSGVASGPVVFLEGYDKAMEMVVQAGMRRGANMAVLRVDHPDIRRFINAKRTGGIKNFNLSVAMTDEFVAAVDQGRPYALRAQEGWPLGPRGGRAKGGEVLGECDARDIWKDICEAAWATGDPGLFFIDRANSGPANALPELQTIEATNPCGEQALPPYGVCTLGHLNLSRFAGPAGIAYGALAKVIDLGVHFLDNAVESNPYPLPQIAQQAGLERRVGLGVMGWADLLIRLGIPYASDEATALALTLGAFIREHAVDASHRLAKIRGPFPGFSRSIYKGGQVRRNANLTTVAPTGTVAIIGDCSSGIEPLFALAYEHHVQQAGLPALRIVNQAAKEVLASRGLATEEVLRVLEEDGRIGHVRSLPEEVRRLLATAPEIAIRWHIEHQASWQRFSDSGVSKTINLPHEATVEDVSVAYHLAWSRGCLGITVFRDGSKGKQVLVAGGGEESRVSVMEPDSAVGGCERCAFP